MKENDATTMSTITDEAVEAAARLVFLAKRGVDWDFVWSDEAKRAEAQQDASWFARRALQAALPHLAPQPVVDREALARAAHHHFCIRRSEPNHDPRQDDYDRADEILEILALINGAES